MQGGTTAADGRAVLRVWHRGHVGRVRGGVDGQSCTGFDGQSCNLFRGGVPSS